MQSESVLSRPSLGVDVQLGMLYGCRTNQFFAGASLWSSDQVDAKQEIDPHQVQDAEFQYSLSVDQARNQAGLNVEGSLCLDIGLLEAKGSAKYLTDKASSSYEARIDVTCTVTRRTRRIRQEVLSSMKYEGYLTDQRYTHFVGEVVEGATATLTFRLSCASSEEVKRITGELEVKLKGLGIGGKAKLDYKDENKSSFERVNISCSGAIAENVANFEDARRVAGKLPTLLAKQMNTLSYKLLPLSILNSAARRLIRELDAALVDDTAAAVKAGKTVVLHVQELLADDLLETAFPMVKLQISNMQRALKAADTEFTQAARRLLPELRDGTTDYNVKGAQLREAVALFLQRAGHGAAFVRKKRSELCVLRETTGVLLADGFENHLMGIPAPLLLGGNVPRLLLSFAGNGISRSVHPLQKAVEAVQLTRKECDDDDDDDDENLEWFEEGGTVARLRSTCSALRQLRTRLSGTIPVHFGVATIERAHRPSEQGSKRCKTSVGDVVLDHAGKMTVVTDDLPQAPAAPQLQVNGQSITVSLPQLQESSLVIQATGFVVRYRPRPNAVKDGAVLRATDNEAFKELRVSPSSTSATLSNLFDNCDFEIGVCIETIVGPSPWSVMATARTEKLPSTASLLIDFFFANRALLSKAEDNCKPWELTSDSQTLYLGHKVVAERKCTDARFKGHLAMRIVDVAPAFRPDVPAHDIKDAENTKVVVFTGASGHGKSTEISALVSYLLGGELGDQARVMLIDDRFANQAKGVTKFITCYRIRPLSPLFEGKTLIIVDTPGYGDPDGLERDKFVTAAMSEFFKTLTHVNAIVFTCNANQTRTTVLSPVSTYVFSLFAKNVSGCLRTIYTFSDVGEPLARKALQELQWPVENGETAVNNAAFSVMQTKVTDNIRDWWRMSVSGQFRVVQMLLRMPPIPTDASAQVTTHRLELERKCELVEKKILRTANDAQILIANLGALANAVGAAPGEKVPVKVIDAVQEAVPDGKATTLCIDCNSTCHEICAYGDDADKIRCSAMRGEHCGVCKQHCHWSRHKNAKFIIKAVERTDMIVSEDLIKRWNTNNNTLEGALLDAMNAYLKLQKELREDILYLAELTEKLKNTALLHNPAALMNYVESLIQVAQARGAPAEQLVQLTTAKNTLLLAAQVQQRGSIGATRDSQLLLQVLTTVQKELKRRMELAPKARAREEEKPCSLYNNLRETLPAEIQDKAPASLDKEGRLYGKGALYPANLRAIVVLVQLVLTDGGVVAALVAANRMV